MSELLINMNTNTSTDCLTAYLEQLLNTNDKISIVCIGTDRIIPDSLGPMIGTILSERIVLDNVKIIGTLEYPLHALNMKKRIRREIDKDSLVIAIDACKGNKVGEVQITNKPISPGKGLFKRLPEIGDISILCTTLENGEEVDIYDHKIRLGDVYRMAKTISSSLCSVII